MDGATVNSRHLLTSRPVAISTVRSSLTNRHDGNGSAQASAQLNQPAELIRQLFATALSGKFDSGQTEIVP